MYEEKLKIEKRKQNEEAEISTGASCIYPFYTQHPDKNEYKRIQINKTKISQLTT